MSEVDAFRSLRLAATQSAAEKADDPGRLVQIESELAEDLVGALPARRSVKYFLPEQIEIDWLLRIRPSLLDFDRTLSGNGPALRFVCAVSGVQGRAPGLYDFNSEGLTRLPVPIDPADLRSMTLQPEFGDAALIVVLVGSLIDAVGGDGPNGHRQLLQRAGALAELVWLSAVREGYGASIFAGFLPAELKSRLEFDGMSTLQLIAIAVGMEDLGHNAIVESEAMGALG